MQIQNHGQKVTLTKKREKILKGYKGYKDIKREFKNQGHVCTFD